MVSVSDYGTNFLIKFGDVVDEDEKMTGCRREGIYTGTMAIFGKASVGIGTSLAVMLLSLDESNSAPVGLLLTGPVAAVLIYVGTAIFRRHQIDG